MTVSDSQKAVEIAKSETFQARIRRTILSKVQYYEQAGDAQKDEKLAAGQKIWGSQLNLNMTAHWILADPNVLNKCGETSDGVEVTDYDLEAKCDSSLLLWGEMLG
jgi:hypothetical protein